MSEHNIIEQVSEWKQIEMENSAYHEQTEFAHQQDDNGGSRNFHPGTRIVNERWGSNVYCCAHYDLCL